MFYEILRKKRPLNLRPHNVHVFCLEKKVLADVTVLHGDARHHHVVELTIVGEVRLGGLDRGNHLQTFSMLMIYLAYLQTC